MNKYTVRVFIPTVYEISASNTDVAERKAIEKYKKETKSGIDPEVEVMFDGQPLIKPQVYRGDPDEEVPDKDPSDYL